MNRRKEGVKGCFFAPPKMPLNSGYVEGDIGHLARSLLKKYEQQFF
jgi:hypothetical protein